MKKLLETLLAFLMLPANLTIAFCCALYEVVEDFLDTMKNTWIDEE